MSPQKQLVPYDATTAAPLLGNRGSELAGGLYDTCSGDNRLQRTRNKTEPEYQTCKFSSPDARDTR